MRRTISLVAVLGFFAIITLAQRPTEKKPPKFESAAVAGTAELTYPPTSIAFGTVVLEVTVGTGGEIENVAVLKDIPALTTEAIRCVKKWRFRAATLNGKPVRSRVPVAFTFNNPFRNP